MAYAIDFVLKVMEDLSSSEPVLFQRDGSLYVASAEGFGQIDYGLTTTHRENNIWDKRGQLPEISESVDAIEEWVGDRYSKKPRFLEGEQEYLKAIVFGSDTDSFTLEEITKAAQEPTKLPNDGKIRMVFHGSRYHSHKYGYAADGIDVWVQEARVMDKRRYLEIIKEKEDEIFNEMERINYIEGRNEIEYAYNSLKFPDCVIMTPYIMISLPRGGRLHLHRDEPDSWTQRTRLEISYSGSTKGSILHYWDTNTYHESPFGVNVKVNAQSVKSIGSGNKLLDRIGKELEAVNSNMKTAEDFVERMNTVHNRISAPNIEWIKGLRKRQVA